MTNTENLSINRSKCSRSRCFPPSVLLYSCLDEIHVCASLFLLICITYAPLYMAQSLLLSVQKRTLLELSSCSSAFSREQRQLLTAAPCVPADHLLHTSTNSHYNEVFGDVMRLSVNIYVSFC